MRHASRIFTIERSRLGSGVTLLLAGVLAISALAACGGEDAPAAAEPTATTVVVAPTPDADGNYRGVTPAEAQALVDFPLVFPSDLPEGVQPITELIVTTNPNNGDPDLIMGAFRIADRIGVSYNQTSMALNFDDGGELIDINGTEVQRQIVANQEGRNVIVFKWNTDGHGSMVYALESELVTPELMESVVRAILS